MATCGPVEDGFDGAPPFFSGDSIAYDHRCTLGSSGSNQTWSTSTSRRTRFIFSRARRQTHALYNDDMVLLEPSVAGPMMLLWIMGMRIAKSCLKVRYVQVQESTHGSLQMQCARSPRRWCGGCGIITQIRASNYRVMRQLRSLPKISHQCLPFQEIWGSSSFKVGL